MKKWNVILASAVMAGSLVNPAFAQDSQESTTATATVKSEAGAESVTATIEGESISVVSVDEAEASDEEEAESTSKVSGSIVIIGPDGQKTEYKIGKEMPEGLKLLLSPEHKGVAGSQISIFRTDSVEVQNDESPEENKKSRSISIISSDDAEEAPQQRLMIGVHCEEGSELLRGHLKLNGAGLVVLETVSDSPAAAAGLQKNDIILKVGETEMKAVTDLLDVVTKSEGHDLAISILRNGDPMSLNVTPRMMEVPEQVVFSIAGENFEYAPDAVGHEAHIEKENLPEHVQELMKNSPGMKRLRLLQPGSVMIDRKAAPEEIERMLKEAAEAARAAAGKAQEQAIIELRTTKKHEQAEVQQQLEELREQLKAMKAQIDELSKKN